MGESDPPVGLGWGVPGIESCQRKQERVREQTQIKAAMRDTSARISAQTRYRAGTNHEILTLSKYTAAAVFLLPSAASRRIAHVDEPAAVGGCGSTSKYLLLLF